MTLHNLASIERPSGTPFTPAHDRYKEGVRVVARQTLRLNAPLLDVWPTICQSFMALPAPSLQRLGIPSPVSACFPISAGGVGQLRVCRFQQGAIWQRVLEWQPRRLLSLEMVSREDVLDGVVACDERFEMSRVGSGLSTVKWTITLRLERSVRARAPLYYASTRMLQRYIARNWRLMLASEDRLPW